MKTTETRLVADTGTTLVYPIQGFPIDPHRLLAEFRGVEDDVAGHEWKDQSLYRNRGWKGIALYSASGRSDDLGWVNRPPIRKTPKGEMCPYIVNELLPQFEASWLRAAFYKLEAGARIGEHRDLVQSRASRRTVRIHIPVITNENVTMIVDRRPYHFPAGTVWLFDPTARHSVENNSDEDRIHLLVHFRASDAMDRFLKPPTSRDRLRYLWISVMFYLARVRRLSRRILGRPKGKRERN